MATPTQFRGLVLLFFLLVGVAGTLGNAPSNDLEEDNNGITSNKLDSADLIDQVLSSDYFEDVKDAPAEGGDVITTSKTFCVGCPIEVDVENPKIKEMATFAFESHLNKFEGLERAQRMVRVVNAMTQVVAGQKYILDLEVGLTNCTKAQHDRLDQEQCTLDPKEETFICNFEVVEQNWLNNKEVVRSNCKRVKVKGDTDKGATMDVKAEDAGIDYDDGEDDGDDDDVDRDGSSDEVVDVAPTSRQKRNAAAPPPPPPTKHILGGSRDTEESPEKLMELAIFAVKQLDTIDADDDARLVMEVLDSKKQTVSGWLYELKIRVAHTTCKEEEEVSLEKCGDKIVPPFRVCTIKILFQPWQEVQKKVTESQCLPEKAYYKKKQGKKHGKQLDLWKKKENEVKQKEGKRALGGFHEIDVKAEELAELANFIVESIDAQSNAMHAQKLVKIVAAQRQVVAGLKTKMVVELGYTSCRKHPTLDKSGCEIDATREHQFCNVTVWEQPWLKSKQITQSKCGPRETMFQESRSKRSLGFFRFKSNDDGKDHHEKDFKLFMKTHGKTYENDQGEYNYRLGVFKENMKKVKLLQDNEQGNAVYGPTRFSDMTEEEFTKHHLGLRPSLRQGYKITKKAKIPQLSSLPNDFDWRNYNAVTPVKNQGMCGSCWAFSVTGNIEGLYARKHNKLMSFSEQELVDCDTLDEGCNGGLPENAYKSLEKLGGLETETEYPYDGKNEKCSFNASMAAAKVKGFVELPKNETEMAMWLVKNGPISIGINANAMQFYMGGVSHPWKFLCGKKSLDHGVLIVGLGVHTTSIRHKIMPYWIVKNSWGPSWGEQGYYRVYRGDNTCGIAEMATSAVVE